MRLADAAAVLLQVDRDSTAPFTRKEVAALSSVLEALLSDSDPAVRAQALAVIAKLGSRADDIRKGASSRSFQKGE